MRRRLWDCGNVCIYISVCFEHSKEFLFIEWISSKRRIGVLEELLEV